MSKKVNNVRNGRNTDKGSNGAAYVSACVRADLDALERAEREITDHLDDIDHYAPLQRAGMWVQVSLLRGLIRSMRESDMYKGEVHSMLKRSHIIVPVDAASAVETEACDALAIADE